MTAVLSNRSAADRPATDFYPTPPEATHALASFLEDSGWLDPDQDTIWEPACGKGHMTRALESRGYTVVSSDKYDDSFAVPLQDFLEPAGVPDADWIITNPPFIDSEAFIRQAWQLGRPFALLLKSQYWHAKRRASVFEAMPPSAVLPLTWRPDFLMGEKGGAPTMEVAWTVWGFGGPATYQPLTKPKLSN